MPGQRFCGIERIKILASFQFDLQEQSVSQSRCCQGKGTGRAGRKKTFLTVLALPWTRAQGRLSHNTDVTTMTSQGQARDSEITLHCSLQILSSVLQLKLLHPSCTASTGLHMAPNALQGYRTARAQLSVPLLPAGRGRTGQLSRVFVLLPHTKPSMDSQEITVGASWVVGDAQVTHTSENFTALMCFKPFKSEEQLYSAAKDPLKFKHLSRASLFQQEQQQSQRGSFRILFWLILSVFIANGNLWGVKEFLE